MVPELATVLDKRGEEIEVLILFFSFQFLLVDVGSCCGTLVPQHLVVTVRTVMHC